MTDRLPVRKTYKLYVGGAFPRSESGRSYVVRAADGTPIAVERSLYWNANGVIWEGGGNTVATRLQ